jgi:hypothetical protein
MSWITITADEVKTRLAGAELSAFQTAALATGQTDPLPEITAQVVDEVRGYVAACRSNTLGPAGTIPPRLLSATLAIIRFRLANRLPGGTALVDDLRVKEYEGAVSLLGKVAECDFAVEDPTGDATSGAQTNTPRITPRVRRFDRCSQEGL